MIVTLKDGSSLTCDDEAFAQGVDGAAHWSADGKSLVKLYHQAESWREATLDLIVGSFNAIRGEPYYESVLCWPTGVVTSPKLGVVMPRAAPGMDKLARLILPKYLNHHPEYGGRWDARVTLALRLARAVRRLHNKGLCHSDLSDNNVFGNSSDGRTYVIDCDGLVVPTKARPIVVGTKFFMAPEVVAGSAGPSVEADAHSLAVLIYHILFLRHPLRGRKTHSADPDENEFLQLGEKAQFIEHPSNRSNRPEHLDVPSTIVGTAVNKLFLKAFVDGLQQRKARPLASSWERDLVHLLDTLIPCANPTCKLKSFPLPETGQGQVMVSCPWCKTRIRGIRVPVLRWSSPIPGQVGLYQPNGRRKVAWPALSLHEWHVRPNILPGPGVSDQMLAYFATARDGVGVERIYLVNDRLPYLEAADPGGAWKRIRTREAAELKDGRRLRFGPPGIAPDAVIQMVTLA